MVNLIYDQEKKVAWLAEKNVSDLAIWIEDFLRNGITKRLSIYRQERRDLVLVHYLNNTDNASFIHKFRDSITELIRTVTLTERNLSFYNDLITIAGLTRCVDASGRLDQIAFGGGLKGKFCGVEELHEKTLAVLLGFRERTLHAETIIRRDIEFPQYCQLCFRGCLDLLGIESALDYLPKLLYFHNNHKRYSIFPALEILVDHMELRDFAHEFLSICSMLGEDEQVALVKNLFYTGMNIRLKRNVEMVPDCLEFTWKDQSEFLFPDPSIYAILEQKTLELLGERKTESPEEIDEDIEEILEALL